MEKGNVLFLILIAVALFAALSYAVSQNRTGTGNTRQDQINLQASRINNYISAVSAQVERLRVSGNCQPEEFDFRNTTYRRNDNTLIDGAANPTLRPGCAVFISQGGSLPPEVFTESVSPLYAGHYNAAADWKGGHVGFRVRGVLNVGTSTGELVMMISGIDLAVCNQVMSMHGIPTPISNDSAGGPTNYWDFTTPITQPIGDENTNMVGRHITALPLNVASDSCVINTVLIPR